MAQNLRTLAALIEDPDLIHSTPTVTLNHL